MDQSVKEMLKVIEEDGLVLAKKVELCKETRPNLVCQIDEFNSMYRLLTERYNHLVQELQACNLESDFAPDSSTPEQKLCKTTRGDASVSSHGASSDVSVKEGCDSSSLSSDSESESFNSSGNAYFSCLVSNDGKPRKILDLGFQLPHMEEKLLMEPENVRYGRLEMEEAVSHRDLLDKLMICEEELRFSKVKLQLSEDEVIRLQSELGKSESLAALAEGLQNRIGSVEQEIWMKETDLETERSRVLQLQKQIDEGLPALQDQLISAEAEITVLQGKLDSETKHAVDLQERIMYYENELSDRNTQIGKLEVALINAEDKFLAEKSDLHADISSLTETRNMLAAKLEQWECQCKSMEDKLKQCEAEKVKMKDSHDNLASRLLGEINQLKEDLIHRNGHVETVNKSFDNLKFKFDMLVAEKDGFIAKVKTLTAEISHRDKQIEQMEGQIRQMQMKNIDLIAGSESDQMLVEELTFRVLELEKEIQRQKDAIAAGGEEKREAIRQLCFSLDHYRSGYRQLCQAFMAHGRHAVTS